MEVDSAPAAGPHLLTELGHRARLVGDELHSSAEVTPPMHVPGTTHLRTSILAVWADTLTGLLVAHRLTPRVPVTLELDVHLYAPAPAAGEVRGVARTLKAGRAVQVAGVDFTTGDGARVATAAASFVTAPDPSLRLPPNLSIDAPPPGHRLTVPFALRAGCARRGPGVAVLARSEDGLNSSNTVNGGLIALAAEEAALSLAPGATLCSLGLRYLQPVRVGPLVATASGHLGLAQVELRDAGRDDRLAALATTRTFG